MNQSPGSIITKMSSMRKLDQNNPNPSSMFTPGHYDYSNNSEISFCIDDNMTELKGTYTVLYFFLFYFLDEEFIFNLDISYSADQISLYGGSVRNFCECPNLSPINENLNLEDNENVPSTSKTRNFSRIYFLFNIFVNFFP